MEFYSNGKLLISGEYVVLDGALAFALPTQFGQSLKVEQLDQPVLYWKSYDVDGQVWMDERVNLLHIVQETNLEGSAYLRTLVNVLRVAHRLNPFVLSQSGGFNVESRLTFPRLWGLGTSSTWINNVAQWFAINPYQLLRESFGGSGYDIACAQYKSALFYQLTNPIDPYVELIDFNPLYQEQLFFVYLDEKQSSKEAITAYRAKKGSIGHQAQRITEISKALANAATVDVFQTLLQEHEAILGTILGVQPIQARLFPDFQGVIKSLGAWGGDFVLVVAKENPTAYFKAKGYTTIIPYQEMIAV